MKRANSRGVTAQGRILACTLLGTHWIGLQVATIDERRELSIAVDLIGHVQIRTIPLERTSDGS